MFVELDLFFVAVVLVVLLIPSSFKGLFANAPVTRITAPSVRERIMTEVTVSFWESRFRREFISSSDCVVWGC